MMARNRTLRIQQGAGRDTPGLLKVRLFIRERSSFEPLFPSKEKAKRGAWLEEVEMGLPIVLLARRAYRGLRCDPAREDL